MEDIFIAIGFIVFSLVIIYYFGQPMSLNTSIIEGLENKDETTRSASGLAGGAITSIDAIKAETVKIQDELLTEKYKADYEKKIIALDDLIDAQMLKAVLSFTPGSGSNLNSIISQIYPMKMGRDALNDVMKALDKTPGSSSSVSSSSLGF